MFDFQHSEFQFHTKLKEVISCACDSGRSWEGKTIYFQTLAALVPFTATVERHTIAPYLRFDTNPVTASNVNLNAGFISTDSFQSTAMNYAPDTSSLGIATVAFFEFNHLFNNIKTVLQRLVARITGC